MTELHGQPRGRLATLFEAQASANFANPVPSIESRLKRISTMSRMVHDRRQIFQSSIAADFGSHHPWLVDLMETGPVISRVRHIKENLVEWLKPRKVDLGPEHGSSAGEILYLPKGVMGNISPWNFAVESALVMCVDMLAAGNTVIIKPSELAPHTAQALDDAITDFFEPEVLAVVQGGPDLAEEFAGLPWDHLTFTGGGRIGKLVAQAAAKNLTPLTLELGGKNPALFARDGVTPELVKLFLSFKALKAGQVCTAPDHVFVHDSQMEDWVSLACRVWSESYPNYVRHGDATGIINDAHYNRLMGYLDEARARGVRVVGLNEDAPDRRSRHIPMTLVIDPPEDVACMTEEIFGPVIPVIPYQTEQLAMKRIRNSPAPLGSYIASHDLELTRRFLTEVRSGGAAVNNFGFQGGHVALPFGGVGASGYGCHSSREGVLGYSQVKSVFFGAEDSLVHKVLEPPLSALTGFAAESLFPSVTSAPSDA